MTKDEALKLALDALEHAAEQVFCQNNNDDIASAITVIKAALAQSTAQWTGLTDEQIHKVNEDFEQDHGSIAHTRAIEAKLKELNQ